MLDDHMMFLQGLKNLLALLSPELCVETTPVLADAIELVRLRRPDLVLLDWHLADCDGETSICCLREAQCTARIVVLSGETNSELIRRAVDLGAAGFIPKRFSSEMMVEALGRILSGHLFLPAEALRDPEEQPRSSVALESDPRFSTLTPRQIDVYLAATRGLPNKLIARELNIAESTVKTHLTSVFAALGVRNRTEAAYQASRDGIRIV